MTTEDVRDAYAAAATRYIDLLGAIERVHADDLAFIHRHLGALTGSVLDLGCGPGHLTAYLHSIGVDVTGIDLVPAFVSHAQATHRGAHFWVGSMTTLDLPDRSVAGLLAWYSLIHLAPAELDDALAGFHRILAPGGVIVAGLVDGDDDVAEFDHQVFTAYRWPADEVTRRLARAGFVATDRLQRTAQDGQRPHLAVAAQRS
jgi:SAM-dependent methyltransferase